MHKALAPGVGVPLTAVWRRHKPSRTLIFCGSVILALVTMFVPLRSADAATPTTGAYFLGSFISPAEGTGFTYVSSSVTASNQGGGALVFTVTSPSDTYSLHIQSANGQSTGQPIAVGNYPNAGWYYPHPGAPSLDIVGDGADCVTFSGSLNVYDATYDGSGHVLSFATQFTANCQGGVIYHGFLSYQSSVTMPTWVVPSTSSMDFGQVTAGDESDAQNVTLTNLGAPTTISDVSFSGQAPDDYIGRTDCTAALMAGQTCTLQMAFIPGALDTRTATATPVANTSGMPSIALTGIGTAGYFTADSDGFVNNFGDAGFYGDMSSSNLNEPIVSMAAAPGGGGYWLLGRDGGVFAFGDAGFFGSTGNLRLNQPVVGMTPTYDGNGYWFVASDGGVFAFGDAGFYGSMGGSHLNKPIVGMTATPDGNGYYLVASDGGVFAFGDARFFGSMGGKHLNQPIVGMAASPDGNGYWFVASDGGIFAFGDAGFYGSTGAIRLNEPIVGMTPTWDGKGYWFVASDGGIFSFGDAPFFGSSVDPAEQGVVAMAGTAPATLQAILGIPALRGGGSAFDHVKPGRPRLR